MATRRGAMDVAGVLLIVGVCALGALFVRYHVRDHVWPRNFGVVEEGRIYRAGRQTPAMMARLVREHGIKTIVDLGNVAPGSVESARWDGVAKALGVERFNFLLWGDGTGDPNQYVEALMVVNDPARQPVLVHCAAGAQRTSACTIFYRANVQGWPIDKAIEEAGEFRHDQARNPNLRRYVERWNQAIGESLKSGARIPYGEAEAMPVVTDPNR
jgi:protein tyrosine/serine phosphatase